MNGHKEARQPLALPSRMAATDAIFWFAESALPIFRPIIAGLYILFAAYALVASRFDVFFVFMFLLPGVLIAIAAPSARAGA